MRYHVTHRTEYRYPCEVSASYGQMHQLPRATPGQTCQSSSVTVEPPPDGLRERLDFFGNRAVYFAVLTPHTRLAVTVESVVDVRVIPIPADQRPWEQARDRLGDCSEDEALDARQFTLDSPLVAASPALAGYAQPSFGPGRPLLEALADLSARIHRDFAYTPGVTSVRTTIDEVLARRAGVCQDFAHLAVGCLRSMGLAARYVSGYLETRPPPGRPRLQGADRSHAWASVFLPGAGWIDADPTNDQLAADRYVTTAWGRDYRDVAPLKGVIFTEGEAHAPDVRVDVVAIDGLE